MVHAGVQALGKMAESKGQKPCRDDWGIKLAEWNTQETVSGRTNWVPELLCFELQKHHLATHLVTPLPDQAEGTQTSLFG